MRYSKRPLTRAVKTCYIVCETVHAGRKIACVFEAKDGTPFEFPPGVNILKLWAADSAQTAWRVRDELNSKYKEEDYNE